MISLADPRTTNPVLCALQIKPADQIIAVKENGHVDSNFILTHLMKQIFYEKNKLCLVSFHNPLEHYQNVGKKLGYDLLKASKNNEAEIIEPIKNIVENIGFDQDFLQDDKENIVKCLYFNIKDNLERLLKENNCQVYLIIDDLSHLLDLGVEIDMALNFVNYCVNLINTGRISLVLSNHVSSKMDEIISNSLQYVADVHIEVSPLKTGQSHEVTGSLFVQRSTEKTHYQFKTFDRGVKTFHPGESIYHLYK